MPSRPHDRHPFSVLTPPGILDVLDGLGLHGDGRLMQLNSYENRVYQVMLEDGESVVVKFYRPGRWTDTQILEEHAFAAELAAEEVPVIAPCTLHAAAAWALDARALTPPDAQSPGPTMATVDVDGQSFRVAVYPRSSGQAPELESPDTLAWLGRFLGRCHAVGARRPFAHRRTLDATTFGRDAIARIEASGQLGLSDRSMWLPTAQRALDAVSEALASVPARALRLHGDCHPGNILWRSPERGPEAGPRIVDLDDAVNGPAVQDLWMLLSGDDASRRAQLRSLLQGYRQFHPFDPAELALIEPLRTLRMLHHSAWIADRWDDPAFPAAFPWFGTPGYWGQQALELKEQLAAMAEPPLTEHEPY